jgi:hypothetical protein
MTKFSQATFAVAEDSRSEVPDAERRKHWNDTFAASSCRPCAELDYAQAPMRNKTCPRCSKVFCPEHLVEHNSINGLLECRCPRRPETPPCIPVWRDGKVCPGAEECIKEVEAAEEAAGI